MKKLLSVILAFVLLSTLAAAFAEAASAVSFEPLVLPDGAIADFDESMLGRVSSRPDQQGNRGFDEQGIYISPYWVGSAGGRRVPVYAVMNYNGDTDSGVLQSIVYLYADDISSGLTVSLERIGATVKNAVILPGKNGAVPVINGHTVTFTAKQYGSYTCLINDDSLTDAVTVFVKERADEEAEIAAYIDEYGADRVQVIPAGYTEADYIDVSGCDVLYFRRGSYISVRHFIELKTEEQLAAKTEFRPSFLGIYNRDGFVVDGAGFIDFNRIDRNEMEYVNLSFSRNCDVSGMAIVNSGGWTVTTHMCKDCTISDLELYGYRTNSDAVNVCCSEDITVRDCFARNGDDCFSVKTTNTDGPSKNILVENCVGWSNKCRCFGITGEVYAPIENVTFRGCSVLYRNATWDNNRVSALAVSVEYSGQPIKDVVFEDIDIYRDDGRAINVLYTNKELTGRVISGVVFRNVRFTAAEKSRLSTTAKKLSFGEKIRMLLYRMLRPLMPFIKDPEKAEALCPVDNQIEVTFDNVTANGKVLNKNNFGRYFTRTGNETVIFAE